MALSLGFRELSALRRKMGKLPAETTLIQRYNYFHTVHPDEMIHSSDWSVDIFIMVVYEGHFSYVLEKNSE